MLPRPFRAALMAPLLLCLTLTATGAQEMRAKDAWDALREVALGAGLTLSAAGIDQDGAALLVRDVHLHDADNPFAAQARLPVLRIEPRGGEGVALSLPEGATLASGDLASEQRAFALEADGAVLMGIDAQALRLAPQLAALRVTMTEASRHDRPLSERFSMEIEGLMGQVEITGEPSINAEGQLRAAMLGYSFFQHERVFFDMLRDEEMSMTAPALAFSLRELQLIDGEPGFLTRAFAGGAAMRIAFEADASASRSRQRMGDVDFWIAGSGGRSDGLLEVEGGIVRLSGENHDAEFSGASGEFSGTARIAHSSSSLQLPLIPTPDNRPFGLRITLSGVEASAETWEMLGAGSMASDSADLVLELNGHGRWLYDITEAPALAGEPFELERLTLDELALRFGDTRLEGSGQFELEPGSLMSPEPFEQGSGDFTFDLDGGEALLTRLAGEGLIPADQQFLARMMLSALGRSVGEDQLRSEIAIRPGGQILVNGLPLPF